MNGNRSYVLAQQSLLHPARFLLVQGKHNHLGLWMLSQQISQFYILQALIIQNNHLLLNLTRCGRLLSGASHRHLDGLFLSQIFTRQLPYRFWPCRRKHERLSTLLIFNHRRHDGLDLSFKTEIEHTIGFVQDGKTDRLQRNLALLQEIHEPSRCRNKDMRSFFQYLPKLLHLGNTTKHHRARHGAVTTCILQNRCDLDG
mmetsp:Transcript_17202/g.30035  ORF Transcript_17202/g.30035 Transcript_17202/m.30035 type:complete len:200 (-) Transcript_17202:277-876(-)